MAIGQPDYTKHSYLLTDDNLVKTAAFTITTLIYEAGFYHYIWNEDQTLTADFNTTGNIVWDFKRKRRFGAISLALTYDNTGGASEAGGFYIQSSDDNSTWVTIDSATWVGITADETHNLTGSDVTARYLRLLFSSVRNNTNHTMKLLYIYFSSNE